MKAAFIFCIHALADEVRELREKVDEKLRYPEIISCLILPQCFYLVTLKAINMSEVVTISRVKYLKMKREIETLRKTKLYRRLLEFEENIKKGRAYTRNDLGF